MFLDKNSPRIDVPSNIPLFPHQQATLHAMVKSEKKQRGTFVLDDKPGTGKSFSLLALILRDKLKQLKTGNEQKTTLLVIPLSIHQQWLTYIQDFSDQLTVYSLMYLGDINRLHVDSSILFDYDILITTPSFYAPITEAVSSLSYTFHRAIIDEIDSVAFYMEKPVPAHTIWLVSASAKSTESGFYSEHAKKNSISCDPDFIRESITLPDPNTVIHRCRDPHVEILQRVTFQPDKRPLYALNYLPYKFEFLRTKSIPNTKSLVASTFHDLCLGLKATNEQLKFLKNGIRRNAAAKEMYDFHVKQKTLYEMKIEELLDALDDSQCPLCCTSDTPLIKLECCETSFCDPCVGIWKDVGCPVCMHPIKHTSDPEVSSSISEANASSRSETEAKIQTLEKVLQEELQRDKPRILIFSDYSETFVPIRALLSRLGIKWAELEGNQIQLDRNMNHFRNGKRSVLLIDAKNYGSGMNMEHSTAIIIMHKSDREQQIIGRANRCGRDTKVPLHVHKIEYLNE